MYQLSSSFGFLCLLALPLAAQEDALHGNWEGILTAEDFGVATILLTFRPDKTFDIDLVFVELEDFAETFTEEELDTFPEEWRNDWTEFVEIYSVLERFSSHGGTYQISGDSLLVNYADAVVEYIVAGESIDPIEFWTPITRFTARLIAALAAALEGIPEKDYPAFEEAFVEETLAELIADLDRVPTVFFLDLENSYAIDDDTLFITTTTTDDDGIETVQAFELHRMDDASTVAVQTSWGSLKAAWRR